MKLLIVLGLIFSSSFAFREQVEESKVKIEKFPESFSDYGENFPSAVSNFR